MMKKSYTELKSVIIDKLLAIKGKDNEQLFVGVYGALSQALDEGYPYALVLERAGAGNIVDTARNEREWQFTIVIRQAVNDLRAPESAYEALLDAVDRVIDSFDSDPMLEDENDLAQVKETRVVPVEFIFDASQEVGAVHEATLAVALVNIVNRFN